MAPELLDASKSSNPPSRQAADIWALGEIIVRMLTGEPTFKSQRHLWDYVEGRLHFPTDRLREFETEMGACRFVMEMMKARPEDRITSEQVLREEGMGAYDSPSLNMPNYHINR